MKYFKKGEKRGFTLIELLVVIAIIGLLSSIVMASLGSARKKARNVQRDATINQIVTAFNLGIIDSSFPSTGGAWVCISSSCYGGWSVYTANAGVDAWLAPYISKPVDPADSSRGYGGYVYTDNWGNGITWPVGHYVNWILELPRTATSCGGSAYVYNEGANYVQCLRKLD